MKFFRGLMFGLPTSLALWLLIFTVYAHAQNVITLPYAAQAVADIGNGPVKVRVTQGNASIFTAQGSGVGATSGSSTALVLTATPATAPLVGALISGNGITSGTTIAAYNGTTGVTLSAAMTVPASTTVSWGAACPASAAGIPSRYIPASVTADYYLLHTQARVCAISPGGSANTLLVAPIFYEGTTAGGGSGVASFNSRTGAVVPVSADYSFSLIAGQWTLAQSVQFPANSVMANVTSGAAQPTLYTLPACANDGVHGLTYTNGSGFVCTTMTAGAVTSVFGRTGVVVAATNDYAFSQISGTNPTSKGGVGRDASADLVNTVSVADGASNTVSTAIFTLLNAACSNSVTRPACTLFMGYTDASWWGAVCNNSGDQRAPIQNAIDYMNTNYAGGVVYFRQGSNCLVGGTLSLDTGVRLVGSSRHGVAITTGTTDTTVLTVQASCEYCGAENIYLSGSLSTSAAQSAVVVLSNFPFASAKTYFANCFIKGGAAALETAGFDGRMYNCDVEPGNTSGVGIKSTGANFYTDVKLDAQHSAFAGFYQLTCASPTSCENNFNGADFTGDNAHGAPYTHSVYIDDAYSYMFITGGTMASPVTQVSGKVLGFSNTKFGAAITNTAGGLVISSSYGLTAITATGAGARSCAANLNITC